MTNVLDSVTSTEGQEAAPSIVDEIVGEGKTYKSVEELAKGKLEADKHINQIQFENEQMRSELDKLQAELGKAKTIGDVVNSLENAPTETTDSNQPAVNPEDIQSMINDALKNSRSAETAQANRNKVDEALSNAYGGDVSKAGTELRKRLDELGVKPESFVALAETSPAAALKLIDVNKTNPTATSAAAVSRESGDVVPTGGIRNKAYYDKVRQQMGGYSKFFADSKLQNQMQKDFAELSAKGEWE